MKSMCSPVPRRERAFARCTLGVRKARSSSLARANHSLVSSRDLCLPRFFYFLRLSINLLSLCTGMPVHRHVLRNNHGATPRTLLVFAENADPRIGSVYAVAGNRAVLIIRLTSVQHYDR